MITELWNWWYNANHGVNGCPNGLILMGIIGIICYLSFVGFIAYTQGINDGEDIMVACVGLPVLTTLGSVGIWLFAPLAIPIGIVLLFCYILTEIGKMKREKLKESKGN